MEEKSLEEDPFIFWSKAAQGRVHQRMQPMIHCPIDGEWTASVDGLLEKSLVDFF